MVDKAGLFSPDAIKKAIGELERIEKTYKFATIVETVETLRGAKIVEETEKRARASGVNGIYLLIDKDSHLFESNVSPIFRPAIPAPARSAIRDAILADFKKREFDTGLASAISVIEKTLAKAKTEGTLPAVVSPGDHASTMVVHNQIRLTLAGARRIIEGAETKATALGVKENIAVVDDGGHLLAFSRMDGARPASIATALTKATSAATNREETGPKPKGAANPDLLLNLSLQNAGGGKLTSLLGGIPIVVDGQVIGAIGVGGATGEQDVEVAKAGVAMFMEALKGIAASEKSK